MTNQLLHTQPSLFTLIAEDYRPNGSNWHRPGFRALATYRFGAWRMTLRPKLLRMFLGVFYNAMQRRFAHVYGIGLPWATSIGRNATIEHQHGIVVHGACVIGDGCIIRQGVTLGIRDEQCPDQGPRLGKQVSVGAGAKILGDVKIGDGAKIGANAVVLCDVPAGCTAVGVPARVITSVRGRHRADSENSGEASASLEGVV